MERVTEAAVRRQRTIQTTLLLIILATLPCYCVGFVMLALAPQRTARGQTTPSVPAGTTVTTQPAVVESPTITLFPSSTFDNSTLAPLPATPTQIRLPQFTLTFTPALPTFTPIRPTNTPIIVIPPSNTPIIVPTVTTAPPTPTNKPPTATTAPPTATTKPPTATTAPPTATTAPPTATTGAPAATAAATP